MHPITRKLFLFHLVLLAGCHSKTVEARSAVKGVVSLHYIARLYSMRISKSRDRIRLENKWNNIEFETNSRRAWINGVMIWLHKPSSKSGNTWTIHEVDFSKGIDPILRSYAYLPKQPPKLVVIDPGHGGKDTGALGPNKVYEKNVALDISLRVKKLLEEQKIAVRMTRTGDTYPTLQQRSDYAGKVGADLFVSIHADGAGDSSASGVETFISTVAGFESSNQYGQGGDTSAQKNNRYDAANAVLGFSLQSNHVMTSKRSDRGLRRARFAVLKNAPCPAALVECGFLTNPTEENLLNSSSYRENVARGIANGIIGHVTLAKRARK